MGGAFSLCALSAPESRFDEVAAIVNRFEEVAHNYEREHTFNMWFVVAADTKESVAGVLGAIADRTGLDVLNLPKQEEFFLQLRLEA